MRSLTRLSWIALAVASAQLVVAIGLTIAPNPEGWAGGALYAFLYALPLLVLGLALRSSRARWRTVAGWVALALALSYLLVVVGNWRGYSTQQAVFVVCVTAPTVVVDLVIFWAAGLRRQGRGPSPAPPAAAGP